MNDSLQELDAAKAQIGALQKQVDDNDGDDDQTAAFAKVGPTMSPPMTRAPSYSVYS